MKKANKFLILMMTIFVMFFIVLNFTSHTSAVNLQDPNQPDAYNSIMPTDASRQTAYQTLGVDPNSTIGTISSASQSGTPALPAMPTNQIISDDTKSKLVELKNNELTTLNEYQAAYGGATYGLVAFILNKVRVYSIPFCILGIAISSIYQYIVGHRQLEYRDKGFNAMVSMVTILVICQILPLIFAVVVKGWRG